MHSKGQTAHPIGRSSRIWATTLHQGKGRDEEDLELKALLSSHFSFLTTEGVDEDIRNSTVLADQPASRVLLWKDGFPRETEIIYSVWARA